MYDKPVDEVSFRRRPSHTSHVQVTEQPYKESALGKPIPEDIPAVPLHIETLTDRRLTFYQRTMSKEKLTAADEETLQRAMARVTKPERPSIDFKADESGPSVDRMSFFSIPGEEGYESGAVDIGEVIPGLEPGRVVEIRR